MEKYKKTLIKNIKRQLNISEKIDEEPDTVNLLVRNRARCKKCGTIIESKHRHDFVYCECKAIAVDGGREYARRVGEFSNIEELSEYKTLTKAEYEEYKKNQQKLIEKHRQRLWEQMDPELLLALFEKK